MVEIGEGLGGVNLNVMAKIFSTGRRRCEIDSAHLDQKKLAMFLMGFSPPRTPQNITKFEELVLKIVEERTLAGFGDWRTISALF